MGQPAVYGGWVAGEPGIYMDLNRWGKLDSRFG
ncbi:hypothetical protein SDC9_212651 [bioreactor metagenome]|uniref:Uncharacterized protein n=1 Tax=bioreactor metagenome TaxID=1076179 RepID=A0A645K169_9ZZZZ